MNSMGAGSGLPFLRLFAGLWIRIRIRIGSGSRGKKMKKNKYRTFLVDFIYFYNRKVPV
jgi:hypothetical protein